MRRSDVHERRPGSRCGLYPKPPSGRTAELDPAKVNDRLAFANLRKAAIVMITKRSRSGFAVQPGSDDVRQVAALLGGRAIPGTGLPSGAVAATVSPTAKISGCPGTVKSGWMTIRPFRSAATPSQRRRAKRVSGCPDDRVSVDAPVTKHNGACCYLGDCVTESHLDPELPQRAPGVIERLVS